MLFGLFRARKQDKASDTGGTQLSPLVDRIEALERKVARLADDHAELEDGIVRRLDKYRKRMERENESAPQESAPPQRSLPTLAPPARVLSFDPLAVRRGGKTFPGGSR